MIVILDIETGQSKVSSDFLTSLGIENLISNNEHKVLKADGIIIPDCNSINLASKKLQLCNFNSSLRMIKKPILGINAGMNLMTEAVSEENVIGLGFFKCKSVRLDNQREQIESVIKTSASSKLFGNLSGNKVTFSNLTCGVESSKDSTSIITLEGKEICGSLENENYFGVQFNPELSGINGEEVLKSFYKICKQKPTNNQSPTTNN